MSPGEFLDNLRKNIREARRRRIKRLCKQIAKDEPHKNPARVAAKMTGYKVRTIYAIISGER